METEARSAANPIRKKVEAPATRVVFILKPTCEYLQAANPKKLAEQKNNVIEMMGMNMSGRVP